MCATPACVHVFVSVCVFVRVCMCGCLQHNLPPPRCRAPHTIMATAAASAHAPHPRRRSGPSMTRQNPRTKHIAGAASSRVSQNWSRAWRTRRRAERPRARPRAPRAMRKSVCLLSTRRLPASLPLSRCTCPPTRGKVRARSCAWCVDVCRICCGVSPVSPCRMSLGGTASCGML